MLEMPERAFEDCQHKLKNATVKSYRTIMLTSPIGGGAFEAVRPTLMRAGSRFEGVSTPRNEWNRCLQTKPSLEQTSRTTTSKRDRGICSHHTHDAGKRRSKTKIIGQTYNGFANDTITKVTKRGSFTMVEPGDARVISKLKTKRK